MEHYWPNDVISNQVALTNIQRRRLVSTLRHAYAESTYYKSRFDSFGIQPADLEEPEVLTKLPFTHSYEFIKRSLDFRSSPIAIVYCSSGTTNAPKYIFFSQEDLRYQYERTARALRACGVTPDDFVAIAHGFGIWSIGNDFQQALLSMEARVLPVGKGPSDSQIVNLLGTLGVTVVCTSPSFVTRLIKSVLDEGIDPSRDLKLGQILLSGESIYPNHRQLLETIWNAKVFSIFGSSEMGTIGSECIAQKGIHIWEDHFIVEVIDPNTEQTVDENQVGELVLTTLTRQCSPLIRYRTGDLIRFERSLCECNAPFLRVSVLGRVDEVLVLESGEKIWAYQIEEFLKGFPEIVDYQLTVSEKLRHGSSDADIIDHLDLALVPAKGSNVNAKLLDRIAASFHEISVELSASIGATCYLDVRFVDSADFHRTSSGKVLHLTDSRSIQPTRFLGLSE